MATALGQRPKGSWPFVFNIKHPGGSQRQRYRQRYSAGCPLAPCGCRPSARVGALKNIQPSLMLLVRLSVSLRYFS